MQEPLSRRRRRQFAAQPEILHRIGITVQLEATNISLATMFPDNKTQAKKFLKIRTLSVKKNRQSCPTLFKERTQNDYP